MKNRKTNLARIPVQQSFCIGCAGKIKEALSAIEDISNVHLYPGEALVVFNFVRANEISQALNVLTDLGYPEEGEIVKNNSNIPRCSCSALFESQDKDVKGQNNQWKMAPPITKKIPFKAQNSLSPTLLIT